MSTIMLLIHQLLSGRAVSVAAVTDKVTEFWKFIFNSMAIFLILLQATQLGLLSCFQLYSCYSEIIYKLNTGLFTWPHSEDLEILVGCPWGPLCKLCPVGAEEIFQGCFLEKMCESDCTMEVGIGMGERVVLRHVSTGGSFALAPSSLPGQPLLEREKFTFPLFM